MKNEPARLPNNMLRLALSCTIENASGRFHYRIGVLHSETDKPALIIHSQRSDHPINGLYLAIIANGAQYVSHIGSDHGLVPFAESRWYGKGDIHRDFGPAVYSKHYWYMYRFGRQTALTKGHAPAGSKHLSEFFTEDQCSGCAELVSRTSVVSFRRGFAKTDTRIYRTCTGTVIELRYPSGTYEYYSVDLNSAPPKFTSRYGVTYLVHGLGVRHVPY